MAKELSTAGISIGYATESTAGTAPSSFTTIANVKDIPAIADSVASYDATDLSDTEYKKYIPGLKDLGSDIALSVNISEEGVTSWNTLAASAKTAYASGKKTWFKIAVPGWTKSFFFTGIPIGNSFPGASVDGIFEGDLHITPTGAGGWMTSPTQA